MMYLVKKQVMPDLWLLWNFASQSLKSDYYTERQKKLITF